jgi:hypothetical protein
MALRTMEAAPSTMEPMPIKIHDLLLSSGITLGFAILKRKKASKTDAINSIMPAIRLSITSSANNHIYSILT